MTETEEIPPQNTETTPVEEKVKKARSEAQIAVLNRTRVKGLEVRLQKSKERKEAKEEALREVEERHRKKEEVVEEPPAPEPKVEEVVEPEGEKFEAPEPESKVEEVVEPEVEKFETPPRAEPKVVLVDG